MFRKSNLIKIQLYPNDVESKADFTAFYLQIVIEAYSENFFNNKTLYLSWMSRTHDADALTITHILAQVCSVVLR